MVTFNPTTPIWFFVGTAGYIPGSGADITWKHLLPTAMWCEWRGAFGAVLLSAQALGVEDSATVRSFYHPSVLAAMRASRVLVVRGTLEGSLKNGVPSKDCPNVYELWGGVDDVEGARQVLEFRVRRYDGK